MLAATLAISGPVGSPDVNRFRRDIKNAPGCPQNSSRFALEIVVGEIANRYGVKRQTIRGGELALRNVDSRRGDDALKFICGRALMPLAHRRKLRERIAGRRVQVKWRVEDQLAANHAARIITRRVVII